MSDLSVSIVSYHNYKDIARLIPSLTEHTDPRLSIKIYIIDNADEEASFRTLMKEFPQVEYIHSGGNIGFGKGHNSVLERLDSKYHVILNPDVTFLNDALSILFQYMEEHPEVGMTAPKLVNSEGKILEVYRREITMWDLLIRMFTPRGCFSRRKAWHTMQDQDYHKSFQLPGGQGSFFFVRTALLKELGGFDERYFMYFEDLDLCRQINTVSRVEYVPDAVAIHDWQRGSHKSIRLFCIHTGSMFKYFHKWGFRWS